MVKSICLMVLTNVSLLFAADYFPIEIGKSWNFIFSSYSGHGSGGTTKNGNVIWTIISKVASANGTSKVKILQKYELTEKSYRYFDVVHNYDSLYNPPRVTFDTLIFTDSGNICYEEKTERVLIHDPQKVVPEKYCIKDTMFKVNDENLRCIMPADTPCDFSPDRYNQKIKHTCFNYFYQDESIGPIGYTYNSNGTVERTGMFERISWEYQKTVSAQDQKKIKIRTTNNSLCRYDIYDVKGCKLFKETHCRNSLVIIKQKGQTQTAHRVFLMR